MRFFLQSDSGDRIVGWVVPDNPAAVSRVHVSVHGRRVAEIAATGFDANIVALGWHSTGQCVFQVTEEHVPGLGALDRLEIRDADTNMLVYRRAPPEGLSRNRVVLVNTSVNPELPIEAALFPHFRQCYFGIGKFSDEILRVIFDTAEMTSCLMSGAINFPRYEPHFVQSETLSAMLVHDPYVEMAQRLTWLRDRSGLAADPAQNWRLGNFVDGARYAAEFDFTDAKSLKRLFRFMPEEVYHFLYNPLTRQLGTRGFDERVTPGSSIIAVEVLARVGVVGHFNYHRAFLSTLFDQNGITADPPDPPRLRPAILALADLLKTIKVATDMVDFDSVLSDLVLRSVAKGWGA
ncbi:hypothetical protein [Methylobacterium organophilum]|uniref:Uncharacterized protein n=1 Tax=Methylobacterium organophilum TaxID=410 RepID=A0ABQ4TA97_METOR|nr:hypothetical protein [Methylobacterium organophilum]GJE28587.1 hypothetical protein LKMONMHP_3460 [Methylobacterium organophilum]